MSHEHAREDEHVQERALENYRHIVRIPTVSTLRDAETDWAPFDRLIAELPGLYPALHATLEREIVDGHALLYRWPGSTPGDPAVLMAHHDVVSIGDGEGWTHPPFGAVIAPDASGEDHVWGRGSFDDKASFVAILESVEAAVAAGFVPQHDIILTFSHNEEVLGSGTPAIVAMLRERGIHPRFVLDEGGIVGETIIGGTGTDPVLVGVSEKGTFTVRLSWSGRGGHASVPPEFSTTARLARAVTRLQEADWPAELNDVSRALIRTLGPGSSGLLADAAAVLDHDESRAAQLFGEINDDTRAMTHNVPLVSQIVGGHSWNAVPEHSWTFVTTRILPGHTADDVLARIIEVIDDPEASVEEIDRFEPSPISPSSGEQWQQLVDAVRSTYGADTVVAPYVNNGGTDARNYTAISDHVYRFNPFEVTLAVRGRLHAIDERMRVQSFHDGRRFYERLIATL